MTDGHRPRHGLIAALGVFDDSDHDGITGKPKRSVGSQRPTVFELTAASRALFERLGIDMDGDLLLFATVQRFRPMLERALSQVAESIGPALRPRGNTRALLRGVVSGRLPGVCGDRQRSRRVIGL